MRTRIKICGITRPEDAVAAARHGVDAVGLVFYPRSPRNVTITQAQAVVAALPPFVTSVALFVNESARKIAEVLQSVPIGLVQFHGDEPPAVCAQFDVPYIKAIRMREGVDVHQLATDYRDARGLLLDAYAPGAPGGTGATFDWQRVPENVEKPIILAGGLTADNVGEAVRRVRPYAVDVSGGVEKSKGVKDSEKIAKFINEVNSVNE